MADKGLLLIGIDGGATEAKSHQVIVTGEGDNVAFALGDLSVSKKYERIAGFTPVPVADQIAQRNAGTVNVTDGEREQGEKYTDAAAATVIEIAKKAGATKVLMGMGMPGLKTDDGRGINAINNGARTPNFAQRLEEKVKAAGLEIAGPLARLGSDADYCGIGEEFAAEGAFGGVNDAYYVGCGTGIADAMKLGGKLVPFDATKDWLQKSWQIASWLGPTFEKIASANSMMTLYANHLMTTASALVDQGRFPQDEATKDDDVAKAVLGAVTGTLAELIFERIFTIFAGREEAPHRGDGYLALKKDHPYRGTLLDRVVIGQRFGFIWADSKYDAVFRKPVEAMLVERAEGCGEAALRDHMAAGGQIKPGLLDASRLREAPAIGAAIDAWKSR